jgi:hypothetical protein
MNKTYQITSKDTTMDNNVTFRYIDEDFEVFSFKGQAYLTFPDVASAIGKSVASLDRFVRYYNEGELKDVDLGEWCKVIDNGEPLISWDLAGYYWAEQIDSGNRSALRLMVEGTHLKLQASLGS